MFNSLIERKQMSFQSSLEAIRFLLIYECEWQRIPWSGEMCSDLGVLSINLAAAFWTP